MIQLRFLQRHQGKFLQWKLPEDSKWTDIPLHIQTEDERLAESTEPFYANCQCASCVEDRKCSGLRAKFKIGDSVFWNHGIDLWQISSLGDSEASIILLKNPAVIYRVKLKELQLSQIPCPGDL